MIHRYVVRRDSVLNPSVFAVYTPQNNRQLSFQTVNWLDTVAPDQSQNQFVELKDQPAYFFDQVWNSKTEYSDSVVQSDAPVEGK